MLSQVPLLKTCRAISSSTSQHDKSYGQSNQKLQANVLPKSANSISLVIQFHCLRASHCETTHTAAASIVDSEKNSRAWFQQFSHLFPLDNSQTKGFPLRKRQDLSTQKSLKDVDVNCPLKNVRKGPSRSKSIAEVR